MKKIKLIVALLTVISVNLARGQQQLLGKWTNSYNSLLTIDSLNSATSSFSGTYSSTTGSSGTYLLNGKYAINPDNDNLSITFSLSWSSIDGSTQDPSQFWTSVMSGTLFTDRKSMELINSISAASPFAAVQVDQPGIYPESLVFSKQSEVVSKSERLFKPSLTKDFKETNPIEGTWKNSDSSSVYNSLTLTVSQSDHFDYLKGSVTFNDGTTDSVELDGVISYGTSGTNKESFSFSSQSLSSGKTIGFTGVYDMGSTVLNVIIIEANGVNYTDKYTSTTVDGVSFIK